MAGVESALTLADLAGLEPQAGDVVYVSGYDLAQASSGPALAQWVPSLGPQVLVVYDPGPLAAQLPRAVVGAILGRTDILTLSRREAFLMSPPGSLKARFNALRQALSERCLICLRDGSRGCWIAPPTGSMVRVEGLRVEPVVDATGAGDTHTGAFLAWLARGASVLEAARVANVAAALSVRTRGPATAPSLAELAAALGGT